METGNKEDIHDYLEVVRGGYRSEILLCKHGENIKRSAIAWSGCRDVSLQAESVQPPIVDIKELRDGLIRTADAFTTIKSAVIKTTKCAKDGDVPDLTDRSES